MFPLVAAAGGEHYDIAGESDNITFCPLGRIDDEVERTWVAEWLAKGQNKMQVYLGIDVGGTKTDALIADGAGRVLGRGRAGPALAAAGIGSFF